MRMSGSSSRMAVVGRRSVISHATEVEGSRGVGGHPFRVCSFEVEERFLHLAFFRHELLVFHRRRGAELITDIQSQ